MKGVGAFYFALASSSLAFVFSRLGLSLLCWAFSVRFSILKHYSAVHPFVSTFSQRGQNLSTFQYFGQHLGGFLGILGELRANQSNNYMEWIVVVMEMHLSLLIVTNVRF